MTEEEPPKPLNKVIKWISAFGLLVAAITTLILNSQQLCQAAGICKKPHKDEINNVSSASAVTIERDLRERLLGDWVEDHRRQIIAENNMPQSGNMKRWIIIRAIGHDQLKFTFALQWIPDVGEYSETSQERATSLTINNGVLNINSILIRQTKEHGPLNFPVSGSNTLFLYFNGTDLWGNILWQDGASDNIRFYHYK